MKHAFRGLVRDRGFTIVALLSIGLGVGANSAIFSLVDQALFRLLPVREPVRLALLSWNGRFIGYGWGSGNLLSHPLYGELAAENEAFEGVFCRHPTSVHLCANGVAEPVNAEIVSGTYFSVLGVRPALGRVFEESDDVHAGAQTRRETDIPWSNRRSSFRTRSFASGSSPKSKAPGCPPGCFWQGGAGIRS